MLRPYSYIHSLLLVILTLRSSKFYTMKRLNVIILPIVALITIGITTLAQSNKHSDLVPVTNCYGSVIIQYTTICIPVTIVLNSSTTCNLAASTISHKVSSASNFFGIIDCDEVAEVFCCAQIVVDPTPCTGQTRLTFIDAGGVQRVNQFAKISAIYCKAAEF